MARIESQHEHAMASQQEEYNAERQRWQFFYVACPTSSILLNMFPVLPTALRLHPSSSQDERGAEISRLRLAAVSASYQQQTMCTSRKRRHTRKRRLLKIYMCKYTGKMRCYFKFAHKTVLQATQLHLELDERTSEASAQKI